MSPITPFLWFDGRAEEAMQFYTAIFPNSRILSLSRAGAAGPVISGTFELAGRPFMALNGGPTYQFTPAISLFVSCRTQAVSRPAAAGSRTDSGSPGRSSPRFWAGCWATRIGRRPGGPCRRCSRW